ncbi:NAD-dependent protein deacylase Sirt4 [Pectinophora gossypiella]|uniref:NAD-dependent protein deacylase Sirt4 n=1 Tax=Pectinophora gossypiella TaxID=13191 RepID=UPI00214F1FB3|nr:NAD-dependent protein deacylase Sirt4 [Pectinophora gossypiella]XP_049879252.1 NAD-dependent protein deacylase Sirt4 [Pectinophora gossypiella]
MLQRVAPYNFKILTRQITCVPKHKPPDQNDIEKLKDFLIHQKKLLVLTGAGISTESGIPDYRSEEVGMYARSNHKPIQYQEFVKYPRVRQRYWARNFVGWPRFSSVQPNASHHSVRELEKAGKVTAIVTQNVDRLHHKAGSENVIELHGTGYIVKCLRCPYEISREVLQEELMQNNPDMESSFSMIRPDGDVELSKEQVERFKTPLCPKCEGPLKPDIVFFGDNVPKLRVDQVRAATTNSDGIFVLGSTLTVYSSYRIILQAKEEKKRVAVLNIGPTRADDIIDLKISAKCGDILPELCKSILCT